MQYEMREFENAMPGVPSMTITVETGGVRYTFTPAWGSLNFYRYPIVEEALTLEELQAFNQRGESPGAKCASPEPDMFVSLSAFGRNCEVTREVIDDADA
jgi:hypothetical protein